MFSRFGLRFGMAASYVLVSAAAVLLVEAVLLAIMVPRLQAASDSAEQARILARQAEADNNRTKLESVVLRTGTAAGRAASVAAARTPGESGAVLLAGAAATGLKDSDWWQGEANAADVKVDTLVQVLATTDGHVVVSSPAGAFAPGAELPAEAVGPAPHGGMTTWRGQPATWAVSPVEVTESVGARPRVIGLVYARMGAVRTTTPVDGGAKDKEPFGKKPASFTNTVGSLILPGVIALVLLVPVGALFGLLSTGRLIRRVRRLAEGTSAMADGDLRARIPVSGGDEVGRLERSFNTMAERLDSAVEVQRRVAGAEARRAERTRIARELHDSISQDLFSASLLASGLRKALPLGSELHHQSGLLEESLARTMREMRAMLLELRPIALEDAGLAEALGELCRAYETRLGISISIRIDDPLPLDAPVEHAVFRVVQETMGNAVRHGEPRAIELRVAADEGSVAVTVSDDGHGFDPLTTTGRHGMGLELMRERVGELGGTMEVLSAPRRGTTVKVLLPAGAVAESVRGTTVRVTT